MESATVQAGTGGSVAFGFNRLGLVRQLGLMVGLAATIAIGFAVVLWSQEPDYRVLYNNVSYADANQIVEQLQLNGIPYKFDSTGHNILVADEYLHKARLRLAAEGFTNDNTVGFELLDKEQGLGTSQFMENARYRRGLEGELARTVTSMLAVRSARVHLALPKQSVFVRDQRKPTASVFLDLVAGKRLEPIQVEAITNLVASSIPELSSEDVTVVDQKGRLLNTRDMDTDVVLAAKQLEYTRRIEETLVNRVNSILQPVVGLGRYRAEVSADIDFTAVEQTDEIYNPDLPALRSEQVLDESTTGQAAAGGVPGALSNQPPGASSVPEVGANGLPIQNEGVVARPSGPKNARSQATRNYELDRSISYTKHQMGQINRLSVAVVVDDIPTTSPDGGETTRSAWDQNELDRLTILVKDAVGYSAVRGDSVSVINSPFAVPEVYQEEEIPIWKQEWVLDLAKQILGGLFVLLLVFGVLRPIMKNLAVSAAHKAAAEGAAVKTEADMASELESLDMSGISADQVTFSGIDNALAPTPNETYEYQMNAIRSMIAEDPAKVAQAIRQWVIENE
ncbi:MULTISPECIES: flagellar basal-body MS-ring/collar protein FliF [Amphritea]|uniref:Flagellar M-ring protein n=2 Tax=Amphritea TaxID=515417 RepID=A0A1H9L910_9GAMM|nr:MULTISPECIES: flagellar basal-body MS-ring/collar protein FliF [Amphritea]MBN0986823.1 flagellar M-ring protein FliF [Amphritea pacifica]MBN1005264.1 flagellar M-ring protein FliF [Amphritea pacifica]SER07687.1 flagellar M-ring protein FliF [Amphritea atlantica]